MPADKTPRGKMQRA